MPELPAGSAGSQPAGDRSPGNAGFRPAGEGSPSGTGAGTSTGEEDSPRRTADGIRRSDPKSEIGWLVAYDLVRELDVADLAAPGLRIDFGTGATAAFTLGRWQTGWGRDVEDGGRTVTVVRRSSAKLFVPADIVRGTVMRVTAKAFGGRRLAVDIAGRGAGMAMLPVGSYGHADFAIPADLSGQVAIGLGFRGSERHAALGRAHALVDRVDFLTPQQASHGGDDDTIRGPLRADGGVAGDIPSFVQPPGTTVRFHVHVPTGAVLRSGLSACGSPACDAPPAGGSAAAAVVVRAIADGAAEPLVLLEATAGRDVADLEASLSGHAGGAARLEFAVASGGPAVWWIRPQVVAPNPGTAREVVRTARNLVVLVVDTLRADRLSVVEPGSRVRAGNLQRWAAEGTAFVDATAPENWTKPSVATLLSGLHPSSHAAQSERSMLPPDVRILPEILRERGFRTACFAANGYVSDAFGFGRGWDDYKNYIRAGLPNRARDVFADAAAWISRRGAGERFFLYIHTIDPHVPYAPPREYLRLYDAGGYEGPVRATETSRLLERIKLGQVALGERDRRRLEALYDAEITYHDDHVPRLYEALAAAGVLHETLVVVTSDHGEEFFERGSVGHGHTLYRELIHVPLFFRLPGLFPAGARIAGPVGLVDVLPTAMETLGLPPHPPAQGRSLLDAAWGEVMGTEAAFSEFLEQQRAVTGSRHKLIVRGGVPRLFDLQRDPGERRDVSGAEPIALRAMVALLSRHLERQELEGRAEEVLRPSRPAEIDSRLEEQLRALGYLGGPQ